MFTMQVLKCPVAGQVMAGYEIREGGVSPLAQKLQDAALTSVLDADISLEHQLQPGFQ
jgi:hypothetical protein